MADADPDRTRVSLVDPLVGTVLDRRYRIDYRLAAGGFGAIYHATHVIHGLTVALKILHAKLASDPAVATRFRREALALGQLTDPHTIRCYDFGQAPDGTLYIAMELLEGESLFEQFRARGPLTWRRMVKIALAACSALGEAHARGIVHRDLKPANIHLERHGDDPDFVKVLDFGIAKILHGSPEVTAGLTHGGEIVGTFDYMAPEQLVGGEVSARSDVFALGAVIYEMISGELPFGMHATPSAMISAILSAPPPPLSTRVMSPPALDDVVARCLKWEADQRYPDMPSLAADLDRVLHDSLEDEDTQTRVPLRPSRAGVLGDDGGATWIDPPVGANVIRRTKPLPPVKEDVDLSSTLRGVGPPKRKP